MRSNVSRRNSTSEAKIDRIAREVKACNARLGSAHRFCSVQAKWANLTWSNIAKRGFRGCEICVAKRNGGLPRYHRTPRVCNKNPQAFQPDFEIVLPRFPISFHGQVVQWVDVAAVAVNSYFSDLSSGTDVAEAEVQSWILQAKTN